MLGVEGQTEHNTAFSVGLRNSGWDSMSLTYSVSVTVSFNEAGDNLESPAKRLSKGLLHCLGLWMCLWGTELVCEDSHTSVGINIS